jgi:DNA replication and repair protein RecF
VKIKLLRIDNCRIISHCSIEPSAKFNLISGPNGSGKSSLLEAISILGTGRSFRSKSVIPIVKKECDSLIVSATIEESRGFLHSIGIERGKNVQKLHLNHNPAQKLSQVAEYLPIQIITPESIDLVLGAPKGRRSFIDWGLFHVEPQYLLLTQKYQKLIKQRNALLRGKVYEDSELDYWTQELAKIGEEINQCREGYLDELLEHFSNVATDLLNMINNLSVSFEFKRGWKRSNTLYQSLCENLQRDKTVGYTSMGPHEADLIIIADRARARQHLSRGQAKLLSIFLYLVQISHLNQKRGKRAVVLVDDLFSELDNDNAVAIYDYLKESDHQVFCTAVTIEYSSNSCDKAKMFHVEHGNITPV